jgi:hypothetical protein
MKIGSKAGPIIVSPAIPKVVTPTLCATKLKSTSDVYTPGETKTLLLVAIFKISFSYLFLYKYLLKHEKLYINKSIYIMV